MCALLHFEASGPCAWASFDATLCTLTRNSPTSECATPVRAQVRAQKPTFKSWWARSQRPRTGDARLQAIGRCVFKTQPAYAASHDHTPAHRPLGSKGSLTEEPKQRFSVARVIVDLCGWLQGCRWVH